MTRLILAAVCGVALLALAAPGADACDCAAQSPESYVKDADMVFLARAGESRQEKNLFVQTLEVLHTLKGQPGKSFTWKRTEKNPLCGPAYSSGEIAIVFAKKDKELGLCTGNFNLASQLEHFRAYLTASGGSAQDAALDPMKVAIEGALKSYLHDRPRIDVQYAPLAGKSFAIGKSNLTFRAAGKKPAKNAVVITDALTTGTVTVVLGDYAREGYTFRAIVIDQGKGPTLLHAGGTER